jgi:uroporphyrinogen decarboxylase
VDKLCRLPENELRVYVRDIIQNCLPGGRFALGSGNTVANYVPLRNYLAMIDEGLSWQG